MGSLLWFDWVTVFTVAICAYELVALLTGMLIRQFRAVVS